MSGRTSPTVEVRHFADGSVEVEISTAYGETIIATTVSPRRGFNDHFAEHDVSFSQRDLDRRRFGTHLVGSEFRVCVPLAEGEQKEVRRVLGV